MPGPLLSGTEAVHKKRAVRRSRSSHFEPPLADAVDLVVFLAAPDDRESAVGAAIAARYHVHEDNLHRIVTDAVAQPEGRAAAEEVGLAR